jgi:cytosine/adenosine deaminase-related metal-dependent hydrolase
VVDAPADLFEPMRDTLRAERQRTGAMWPASAVLPAATVDGARAIGLDRQVGTLAVGKRADIILVDGLAHLTGSDTSAAGALVTALGPANVRAVLVEGRFVKRDGTLVHHDLAALRHAGAQLARRLLD